MNLRYSYRKLQDASDGDEFVTEAPQTQTEPPSLPATDPPTLFSDEDCPECPKAMTNKQPLLAGYNGGSYWYTAAFGVFVVLAVIVMGVVRIRQRMQAQRDAVEQRRSDKLPKDDDSKRKYLQQQFAHQRTVMTVQASDVLAPPVDKLEEEDDDDNNMDKAPLSAPAEPLKLEILHETAEDYQDDVVVAATDNTSDASTEDLSNLDVEGQTTVDSAESTPNPSSTEKAPAVEEETIVKADTTYTKIDSKTKESEKSGTASLAGDGESLSEETETDVEAQTTEPVCITNACNTESNTGSAGRELAEELEQDEENTFLCLPCHHDPEKAARAEKPAAASQSPYKFLGKLQGLSRKSKDTATKKTEEDKPNQTRPRMVPNLCAICLESYQSDDRVVWSNHLCQHAFHQECVVQCWLSQNKEDWTYHQSFSCPTCRQEFMVLHDDERGTEPRSDSNDGDN